ncbi:MAG: CHRD domain-containing protein [Actinomycetota bacterium]|nr:CHRD domain-containing protein [Actinomycetota bacterium]
MLAATLLVAALMGSAGAQEMGSQTLQLTPSRDSGVSGTATLTDTAEGVEATLDMQGLPTADGTEHLAHIHAGATCVDDRAGNGAPVEIPFESVMAQGGAGTSTTVIPDVTVADLLDGTSRYVNVHAEKTGDAVPPGISCADVVSSTVPATGGFVSPMTMLILGGAALVTLATGGVLVRRRA